MYPMRKGIFVSRPNEAVTMKDGRLNRKQIKHIIEHRKAEKKSMAEIKAILDHIPETIADYDFEVMNLNPKYPGSVIRGKIFQERGIVVVLDRKIETIRDVITAYLCSPKHLRRLKNKKLHTSAAGETPHP